MILSFPNRRRSRRLSARAKSEEPEPNKDLLEIDDAKFTVSPIHDDSFHDNHPKEIRGKEKIDKKRYVSACLVALMHLHRFYLFWEKFNET